MSRHETRKGKGRHAAVPEARSVSAARGGSVVPGFWTKERETLFFAELSEVCNVSAAARAIGLSDSRPAYQRKETRPAFGERWERAVAEGYSRLELEMLERARFGEDRPAHVGESGARQRAIPTALALQLLRLHQSSVRCRPAPPPAASRGRARAPRSGRKSFREEMEARFLQIRQRLGGV